jgi:hypothetical protein
VQPRDEIDFQIHPRANLERAKRRHGRISASHSPPMHLEPARGAFLQFRREHQQCQVASFALASRLRLIPCSAACMARAR